MNKYYPLKFPSLFYGMILFTVMAVYAVTIGWPNILLFIISIVCICILWEASGRILTVDNNEIKIVRMKNKKFIKVYRKINLDRIEKIVSNKNRLGSFTSIIPKNDDDDKLCRIIVISSQLNSFKEIITEIISNSKSIKVDRTTQEILKFNGDSDL